MQDSNSSAIAVLAWLHLAFLLVPLMIFTIRLEWMSLHRNQERASNQRRLQRQLPSPSTRV